MTHIVVRFLYRDSHLEQNFISKIELACVNELHIGISSTNNDGAIEYHFNHVKTFEHDQTARIYLSALFCSLLLRNGLPLCGENASIPFLDRCIFLEKYEFSNKEVSSMIRIFPELFV